MEINFYKRKIPIQNKLIEKLEVREEYCKSSWSYIQYLKDEFKIYPFIIKPLIKQIKKELKRDNLETLSSGSNSLWCASDEFYLSLSVDFNPEKELQNIGEKEKKYIFGITKLVNVYRLIPVKCDVIGRVSYEKPEADSKHIIKVLAELGYNCRVKTTTEQMKELSEKLSENSKQPSASEIANAIYDEKEWRERIIPRDM